MVVYSGLDILYSLGLLVILITAVNQEFLSYSQLLLVLEITCLVNTFHGNVYGVEARTNRTGFSFLVGLGTLGSIATSRPF